MNVGVPVFRHYCHTMKSKTFSMHSTTCCSSAKPGHPVLRAVCCESQFMGVENQKIFYSFEKDNLLKFNNTFIISDNFILSDTGEVRNNSFLILKNTIHNKDIPVFNNTLRI